jgi:hypothetical protein
MASTSPEPLIDDALLDELRKRRQKIADDVEAARQAGEVDAYIKLLPILAVLEDKLERVEHRHIRLAREGPTHPAWQLRRDQLEEQFLTAYGNRGPQYRSWSSTSWPPRSASSKPKRVDATSTSPSSA